MRPVSSLLPFAFPLPPLLYIKVDEGFNGVRRPDPPEFRQFPFPMTSGVEGRLAGRLDDPLLLLFSGREHPV